MKENKFVFSILLVLTIFISSCKNDGGPSKSSSEANLSSEKNALPIFNGTWRETLEDDELTTDVYNDGSGTHLVTIKEHITFYPNKISFFKVCSYDDGTVLEVKVSSPAVVSESKIKVFSSPYMIEKKSHSTH
ncbi:MAG: hypothetical protein K2X39_04035, partial [Silvanigrellaceae bacterium]|nr:hypothetical protein [Silvanigrellaceae bacterium]